MPAILALSEHTTILPASFCFVARLMMSTLPPLTQQGLLTPEEFVRAGDQLVSKCSTWQWYACVRAIFSPSYFLPINQLLTSRRSFISCRASGEKSLAKSYLPPNKQFLITRNVPSEVGLGFLYFFSRLGFATDCTAPHVPFAKPLLAFSSRGGAPATALRLTSRKLLKKWAVRCFATSFSSMDRLSMLFSLTMVAHR